MANRNFNDISDHVPYKDAQTSDRLVGEVFDHGRIAWQQLSLTEMVFGNNSDQAAKAHGSLADALLAEGSKGSAVDHYLSQISILKGNHGSESKLLIEPMRALAKVLASSDSFDQEKASAWSKEAASLSQRMDLYDRVATDVLTGGEPSKIIETCRALEQSYKANGDQNRADKLRELAHWHPESNQQKLEFGVALAGAVFGTESPECARARFRLAFHFVARSDQNLAISNFADAARTYAALSSPVEEGFSCFDAYLQALRKGGLTQQASTLQPEFDRKRADFLAYERFDGTAAGLLELARHEEGNDDLVRAEGFFLKALDLSFTKLTVGAYARFLRQHGRGEEALQLESRL